MCSSKDSHATPDTPQSNSKSHLRSRRHSIHRPILCDTQPLDHKNIAEEIRAQKDLSRISDQAPILLNLRDNTPDRIVSSILDALVQKNLIPAQALSVAKEALVRSSPLSLQRRQTDNLEDAFDNPTTSQDNTSLPTTDPNVSKDESVSHESQQIAQWRKNIVGRNFIIPFARISALDESATTVVAIARLATSCNLGTLSTGLTRFVILVLGPVKEMKEMKTPFEVARTLSSTFQDESFIFEAKRASTEEDFRSAMRKHLSREKDKSLEESDGYNETSEEVFMRTGKFAGGLIADIKRRYKPSVYKSDWIDGITDVRSLLKYLSTTVWLYFAIIMPTIAFGALDDDNTGGRIGVIETIVSQAFAGLTFAIFAGQPLTIVMTTAPITVFIDVLFRWCKSLNIPFLPFYAWTGIWTALILIALVVFDACAIMKYCGHFTEEIFATLIAALFISEYIKPLIHLYQDEPDDVFLLAFVLATGTCLVATALLNFRRSFLLKPIIRQLLSDFGVPVSIVLMSGIRQAFKDVEAEPLNVPERIGIVTTSNRNWLVPIFDINVSHIFLAAISGALLATLFFLDQNISSMLVNKIENKLRKGPGYYLDLVVVSVIIVIQSILGMPWTHAALPHSPLHARQLADVEEYEQHGRRYERVVKSRETRISVFATHILVGLSILAKDALALIPLSVLYGFFLFLGFGTLDGNALWDRILLIFTQSEKYPPNHYVRRVAFLRIHLYTAIQVGLLVLLWFVKSNFYMGDTVFNTGLLFPFIIALFIPIRLYILPRIFTGAELNALSKEEDANISDTGITV